MRHIKELFKRFDKPEPASTSRRLHAEKIEALQLAVEAATNYQDFKPYLRTMALKELQLFHAAGFGYIEHVRIKSLGAEEHCCETCQAMDGSVFRLVDELKNQTLPLDGCTCKLFPDDEKAEEGYCLCFYEIVIPNQFDEHVTL